MSFIYSITFLYLSSKMLHVNQDRPSTAGGIRSRAVYKAGGAGRQVDGAGGVGQEMGGSDSHSQNTSQRYSGATAPEQPLRPKYDAYIFKYIWETTSGIFDSL